MKDELRERIVNSSLVHLCFSSVEECAEEVNDLVKYITENYIPKDIFNDFALKCFDEWVTEAQKKKGE